MGIIIFKEIDMFEKATKQRLRFDTVKGLLSVEDLWELPLISRSNSADLDTVAKTVSKELKVTEEESFVKPVTVSNTALNLKLEIVKHIIAVKLQEKENRENVAEKDRKKSRLLEIIDKKQDQELESKTVDELKKDLASL